MFSDKAVYECDDGYIPRDLFPDSTVKTCDMYGNWSGISFSCGPVDCGNPNVPSNGSIVTFNGTIYLDQVAYECDTGFNLTGSRVLTCQQTGNWTEPEPVCEPVDCGDLPDPGNGLVVYDSKSTLYGDMVYYECVDSFDLVGDSVRVCNADGIWNRSEPSCLLPDCGNLTDPSNGFVNTSSGTTLKNTATYSCIEGYLLEGVDSRLCLSTGSWESSEPSCKVKGLYVHCIYFIFIGVAAFHYKVRRTINVSKSSCFFIFLSDCGVPITPLNGTIVTPYGTTFGRVAIMSCLDGFVANSSVYRECLSTGLWSEPGPSCLEVVISMSNTYVHLHNYVYYNNLFYCK